VRAVAELLEDGEVQRYARKARRIYESRRDAMAGADEGTRRRALVHAPRRRHGARGESRAGHRHRRLGGAGARAARGLRHGEAILLRWSATASCGWGLRPWTSGSSARRCDGWGRRWG